MSANWPRSRPSCDGADAPGTARGQMGRGPTPTRALWFRAGAVFALAYGLAGVAAAADEAAGPATVPEADIEVFVRHGCPHCTAATSFLNDL